MQALNTSPLHCAPCRTHHGKKRGQRGGEENASGRSSRSFIVPTDSECCWQQLNYLNSIAHCITEACEGARRHRGIRFLEFMDRSRLMEDKNCDSYMNRPPPPPRPLLFTQVNMQFTCGGQKHLRRLEKLSAQSRPVNQAPAAAAASEPEPERGRKKTIMLPITRCVARDTATTSEPVSPPPVFSRDCCLPEGGCCWGRARPGNPVGPKTFWKRAKNNTGRSFILRRVFTRGLHFMTAFLRHQPQVIMGFPAERTDGGREGWWQTVTSTRKYVTVFLLSSPHGPPRHLIRDLP